MKPITFMTASKALKKLETIRTGFFTLTMLQTIQHFHRDTGNQQTFEQLRIQHEQAVDSAITHLCHSGALGQSFEAVQELIRALPIPVQAFLLDRFSHLEHALQALPPDSEQYTFPATLSDFLLHGLISFYHDRHAAELSTLRTTYS